jgi:hypothetical protein
MKPCYCLIKHAVAPNERERVKDALDYARMVGDSLGITLALAQLSPCPAQSEPGTTADQPAK